MDRVVLEIYCEYGYFRMSLIAWKPIKVHIRRNVYSRLTDIEAILDNQNVINIRIIHIFSRISHKYELGKNIHVDVT